MVLRNDYRGYIYARLQMNMEQGCKSILDHLVIEEVGLFSLYCILEHSCTCLHTFSYAIPML